jgi:hypothetical protein
VAALVSAMEYAGCVQNTSFDPAPNETSAPAFDDASTVVRDSVQGAPLVTVPEPTSQFVPSVMQ